VPVSVAGALLVGVIASLVLGVIAGPVTALLHTAAEQLVVPR
jgi:hydrogenase-4 component F